ncbi:MAG: Gfo/Idh/MocA family oxidoreductase [Armatimonadota bacterium]|nr:MAG: Gfo/Idh/MocA family oxidoreductase [Armatimonadota bacterium]
MAQQEIRVGFIGSGYIARQHAEALREVEGVRFSACMDMSEERAQQLAAFTGGRATASLEEAVEESEVLWVCTPPKHHRAQVVTCLEAGRHVYCEKPLATTVEDGRAIAAAAEGSEALAAIGFNFRFHEPWRKCKELLEAGDLGKPMMFLCQRVGLGATGGWRRDADELCGMTIESLSHNIDLLRFLLGDVASASAHVMVDPDQLEFDICVAATLKLRSGAVAGMQATWASAVPATRHGVVGSAATALIEGPSQFEFDCLRVAQRDDEGERVYRFALPANPSRAACEHFIAAVRGETPLEIPIADGFRALEVSAAMLASAEQGGAAVAVDSRG